MKDTLAVIYLSVALCLLNTSLIHVNGFPLAGLSATLSATTVDNVTDSAIISGWSANRPEAVALGLFQKDVQLEGEGAIVRPVHSGVYLVSVVVKLEYSVASSTNIYLYLNERSSDNLIAMVTEKLSPNTTTDIRLSAVVRLTSIDSLFLYRSQGTQQGTLTLHSRSRLDLLFCSLYPSAPSFHVGLERELTVVGPQFFTLTHWSAKKPQHFALYSGFKDKTIAMQIPCDGVYIIVANVFLKSTSSTADVRLWGLVNNERALQGSIVKMASDHTRTASFVQSALLQRGTTVSLEIEVTQGTVAVTMESTFGAILFQRHENNMAGFKVFKEPAQQKIESTRLTYGSITWSAPNSSSLAFSAPPATTLVSQISYGPPSRAMYFVQVYLEVASTSSPSAAILIRGVPVAESAVLPSGDASLLMTALVDAGEGNDISVGIAGCTSLCLVAAKSSFSVVRKSALYPGLLATLGVDHSQLTSGWRELHDWQTQGSKGTYDLLNSLDSPTGRFHVPVSGVYVLQSSIIVSDVESDVELNIVINGNIDLENGLYAKDGNPTQTTTLTASGILHLNADDVISIHIYTSTDTDWYVDRRSGFSVGYVGATSMGFHARAASAVAVRQTGWHTLKGWVRLWHARDTFDDREGELTITRSGIYYACASIVLQNADLSVSTAKVSIAMWLNGQQTESLAAHRSTANVAEPSENRYYTLSFCGTVFGEIGDKIVLRMYSAADSIYNAGAESSWSVVFVADSHGSGYSTYLQLNKFFPDGTAGQFKAIDVWQTSPTSPGFFNLPSFDVSFDNGIEAIIGSTGIYAMAASILLSYTQSSNVFSLALFVNDELQNNGISYASNQKFSSYSLHLASSLYLIRGDRVSIKLTGSANFAGTKLDASSGWSLVRLGTESSYPMISLQTMVPSSINTTWQSLSGYGAPSFPLTFVNARDIDETTGHYTVHTDGAYVITANMAVQSTATDQLYNLEMAVIRETSGVQHTVTFVKSRGMDLVSLQALVLLAADDKISLAHKMQSYQNLTQTPFNASLEIERGSWFSIMYAPSVEFFEKSSLITTFDTFYNETSEIGSWSTRDGLFMGLGTFVSSKTGVYQISSNLICINLSGKMKAKFTVNSQTIAMTTKTCLIPCNATLLLGNIIRLESNELLSLFIELDDGSSATIAANSSRFITLHSKTQSESGVTTKWTGNETLSLAAGVFVGLVRWQVPSETVFLNSSGLFEDGNVVVRQHGAHFIMTTIIVSMVDSSVNSSSLFPVNLRLCFDVGDLAGSGICVDHALANAHQWSTLSMSGTVLLERWAKGRLVMRASGPLTLAIHEHSSFAVVLIDSTTAPECSDAGPVIERRLLPEVIMTAIVGESVTWSCHAVGDLPITYRWFHNNQPISQTGVSITIQTSFAGNGIYTCEAASNGVTALTNDVELITFDVDECHYGNHSCHTNATCQNSIGSYVCACFAGFAGDGLTCTEIDECSDGTHACAELAVCINTVGSYSCECPDGFIGDGVSLCQDLNECYFSDHFDCHKDARCENLIGSYKCVCHTGYSGNGTHCEDIDECATNTDLCDVKASCLNTNGSHICTCVHGYTGTGQTCVDLDECGMISNGTLVVDASQSCHNNATCINTIGSHYCACREGFTGTGLQCDDVNECLALPLSLRCAVNADCVNHVGNYECQCRPGLTGNGINCYDLDECNAVTDACDSRANCTNTYGSYECTCPTGYITSGKQCTRSSTGELAEDCKVEKNSLKCMCIESTGRSDNILCNGLFVAIIILVFIAIVVIVFAVKYAQARKNMKIKPVRATRDKYIEMENESTV